LGPFDLYTRASGILMSISFSLKLNLILCCVILFIYIVNIYFYLDNLICNLNICVIRILCDLIIHEKSKNMFIIWLCDL
jgi:hypothetical protein